MNVRLKLHYLAKRLSQKLMSRLYKPRQIYLRNRLEQYRELWYSLAGDLSATIRPLDTDIWEIQKSNSRLRIRLHQLPIDNDVVLKLCGRKPVIHKMLQEAQIPVPLYEEFDLNSIDKAYKFLQNTNELVVIKPTDGYSGLGVSTHLATTSQLRTAAVKAALYSSQLMIEQQIAGECFRLLVYKNKLIHAVKRTGLSVTGDGEHSIRELIEQKSLAKNLVSDVSFTLASQGLDYSYIPESKINILVSSVGVGFNGGAELRTIYDQVVTNSVSSIIRADVELCAAIVGSDFLGIDLITCDITQDLRITGGVVNELNTTPALHHHYCVGEERYPSFLKDIAEDLLH